MAVENGPSRPWLPGILVAAIVLSLAAFRIAFVLGAYHTVFYQDIFTVLVASSVTLASILGKIVPLRFWIAEDQRGGKPNRSLRPPHHGMGMSSSGRPASIRTGV